MSHRTDFLTYHKLQHKTENIKNTVQMREIKQHM